MNAAAKVIELSTKRDELQATHKPNEALREQIVALKKKRKKAKTDGERAQLDAEIQRLDTRQRPPGLDAVMKELAAARAAADSEALDALVATFAEKTDEELEALHLEAMAKRAALKPMVAALARARSSRAKVATNRSILKNLTVDEILASLSPEQRAGLKK